ncbi:MAG TPA: hypothetical protein VNN15_07950 [Solirubrobacterales bacterium]|nr:hypothetical protein [Solirubrobacterales bacterium]
MQNKLVASCIAVAALAAFAASAASASPVLTENGVAIPAGASVTAANTGVIKFTDREITEECTTLLWTGTVLQNTGTKIQLEFPKGLGFGGTGTFAPCTSPKGEFSWSFKSKLCFEANKGSDNVVITGCGANLLFTIGGECEYSAASITGTFTTNSDATITLANQSFERIKGLFIAGGIPCTTPASIDLVLDLTTTNGTTLSIS